MTPFVSDRGDVDTARTKIIRSTRGQEVRNRLRGRGGFR
jgi:hypothetical protein